MQEDVPRITQRTAIIYTVCPSSMTAGELAVSGGVPYIRQVPQFESITGIASISGGYADNRIRVSATSGGEIEWKIFSANWAGKVSFNLTAVTSGAVVSSGGVISGGWLPGSATYPITLYAFGHDRPYLPQTFFEYQVGEEVDITLAGTCVGNDLMEATPDGATMLNRANISAGLRIDTENDRVRIHGTAEVPGIYTLGVYTKSKEKEPPRPPVPFPPGEAEDLVIISIYGEHIAEGDPVVMVPAACKREDAYKVVYNEAVTAYGAKAGVSAMVHSGGEWVAEVTSGSEYVSERWRYNLTPISGGASWEWGVTYSASVGEGFPVSETLATAPGRDLGGEWQQRPPLQGWSPTLILQAGDERLFLDRQTSGGLAGVYVSAGSASGAQIYEQEPLYTPQYSGWTTRPPMIRNSSGGLVVHRSGGYFAGTTLTSLLTSGGVEVHPHHTAGVVLPYCPPRCVECGNGVKWSDPGWLVYGSSGAVTVQAINTSGSECTICAGRSAGAGWGGRYPMRRLLPLFRPDGARSATFTATKREHSSSIYSAFYSGSAIEYYPDTPGTTVSGLPRNRMSGGSAGLSGGSSSTSAHVSRSIPLDGVVWSSKMLMQEFGNESVSGGITVARDQYSGETMSDFTFQDAYDVTSGWRPIYDRATSSALVTSGRWGRSATSSDGVTIDATIYYGDGRDCIDSGGRMFVAVGQARATGLAGLSGTITTNFLSSAWNSGGTSLESSAWTSSVTSTGAVDFAHSIADLWPHVFTDATPHFSGEILKSSGSYEGTLDCNAGVLEGVTYSGGYYTSIQGGLTFNSLNTAAQSAWYTQVTTSYVYFNEDPAQGEMGWVTSVTSTRRDSTGAAALNLWNAMPRAHTDPGFVASGGYVDNSGTWIAQYTAFYESESTFYEKETLTL